MEANSGGIWRLFKSRLVGGMVVSGGKEAKRVWEIAIDDL